MSPPLAATATADGAPKSTAEKMLAAVPVALTALATVLAGLSSSEMTRSMYYRALASQQQAKAGSQWAFFQAKRMRGTTLEATVDLAHDLADIPPFDAQTLRNAAERTEEALRRAGDTAPADQVKDLRQRLDALLNQEAVRQELRYLTSRELPAVEEHRSQSSEIARVSQAIRNRQTEAQTAEDVTHINPERLEEAIEQAEANAEAFDKACQPVTQLLRDLESLLTGITKAGKRGRSQSAPGERTTANREPDESDHALKSASTSLRTARQDFTARRYEKEARYNQEAAELYEVQVRRSGVDSERHRNRSKNFFYAMLCAQAGVTVSSLALARSRRSPFWAIAGMAGVVAVVFSIYVYLAV